MEKEQPFLIDLIGLGKRQRLMVNGCNSNVNKIKSNSLKERTVYEKWSIEIWDPELVRFLTLGSGRSQATKSPVDAEVAKFANLEN